MFVSPSRLKTFLDCQWAYVGKYIFLLPDAPGPKTRLGSAIHELFETLSEPSKQVKRLRYVHFSHNKIGLEPAILRFLKKLYKRWDIPEELRTLGEKLVYDAFTKGYDATSKVLAVEKRFEIKVSNNIYIKGFIDKVVEVDKDTIELIDYKSGVPFNAEKCDAEFQPFFYKIAAKVLYPQYKTHLFSFHFLKNRKTITVDKTELELKGFLKFIISQGIAMLNISEKNAKPTRSFKCMVMCNARVPNPEKNYMGCPAFYDKNGKSLFK